MAQKDQAPRGGNDGAARPPVPPKAYTSPVLTEYGSIARLTRGGGQTAVEGASGRRMMG